MRAWRSRRASWCNCAEDGHEAEDLGTYTTDPVDYPDYAKAVALAVLSGQAERAILICGSGAGACVAANKFKGIRAATCHDSFSARQCVEDDDVNVLCLGARVIGTGTGGGCGARVSGARILRSGTSPRAGKVAAFEAGVRHNADPADAKSRPSVRGGVRRRNVSPLYCSTSRPTARFNWLAAVM